jgi:hypothetical protein
MAEQKANLLDVIPKRTREFRDEENGTVTVLIPRFGDDPIGGVLRHFFRNTPIRLHLDEVGTEVWRLCDGHRSVYEIGDCLQAKFGERINPVYERLGAYLHKMRKAGIIDWRPLSEPTIDAPGTAA